MPEDISWLSFPKKADVNQLVVRRIRDAVTGELEAKGLRLSSNPDFLIAMHGATKENLDIQDWGVNLSGSLQQCSVQLSSLS